MSRLNLLFQYNFVTPLTSMVVTKPEDKEEDEEENEDTSEATPKGSIVNLFITKIKQGKFLKLNLKN